MGSIYQLTFFLALGLLAIVATLFVLAVSLLGRAIKMASEEQEKTAKQQKDTTEKEIVKMEKEITAARKTGQLNIEDLENRLKEMRKQAKKYERALKRIEKKPRFLKARWGVLIPGAFFIASIILSGLALNLVGSAFIVSLWLWGVAIIAIGIGIYLICQSLMVIEGVAITSEETAFARQAEQLKTALREFEEEKKPKLVLTWLDEQGEPLTEQGIFKIKAEAEKKMYPSLMLMRGREAKNVSIFFNVPPSFSFPGKETVRQSTHHSVHPNYISAKIEYSDVQEGVNLVEEITTKAPTDLNEYTLFYRIFATDFDSKPIPFKVIVY